MASALDPAPAPFVVGVSRSGTTLVRLMLDAHPELAIPAETRFLPRLFDAVERGATPQEAAALLAADERWADFGLDAAELERRMVAARPFGAGAAARAFFGLYAELRGKDRWGDKSPPYVNHLSEIHRRLPEARFVHVIRDGRAVAASHLRRPRGRRRVEPVARRWRREVAAARSAARSLPAGTYLELRYEDLLADPERELRRVAEHLDLGFDRRMLDYHRTSGERLAELGDLRTAAGRRFSREERLTQFALLSEPPCAARADAWRHELRPADRAAFEALAGDLLDELGYG